MTNTETPTGIVSINDFAKQAWDGAEAKGFHAEGNRKREALVAARATGDPVQILDAEENLSNYWAKRIFLVVTELTEAFDELRAGRAMDEVWYSGTDRPAPWKPEGVPSELADTFIRLGDLIWEASIDLDKTAAEKLEYNATRAFMHGKKF